MILRLLKIPKSTYFDWVHFQESFRQREYEILKEILLEIWQRNYSAYGAPHLQLALADLNLRHRTNRIRHLMHEAHIHSVMVRRFNKPTTTVEYKQRPNLIKGLRDANAWSMDITCLKLNNGQWVYLASVLDLRTQTILAHQISATMDNKLVVSTMQRALSRQSKPNYLHTDMGNQFTSFSFENLLKGYVINHSYSKWGHLYDNAKIAQRILAVSKYVDWFNSDRISVVRRKLQSA